MGRLLVKLCAAWPTPWSLSYIHSISSRNTGIISDQRQIELLKQYTTHSKISALTMDPSTERQLQASCNCGYSATLTLAATLIISSYLGYFAGFLFCWNSADQRGVSTPTPESEIEAFNRTSLRSLSAVVFSTRWVGLNPSL